MASQANPPGPRLREGLEIFEDLLRNLNGQVNILGRKPISITVATVCSGTDSPIFALNLIQEAARNLGQDFLHFSHKFACEIETFKQAFIRRNVDQPLIFRNVIDLGARDATKAMVAGGYFADIPSDKIDLFIAGCSCVDYSNLNNARAGKTHLPVFDKYPPEIISGEKKSPCKVDSQFVERLMESLDTIEASGTGESMRTFLSAMSYIIRARPKIVILENVDSAPWAAKTNFWFPRAGYVAGHAKVNSRKYYLPQTRQRGYLVAVDVEVFGAEKAAVVIEKCMTLVRSLERQASCPVTDFLLGPDDPRLVQARADMEQRSANQKDSDWGFSQVRHEALRQAQGISAAAHPFSMAVFSHGRLMEVTPPSRSWMQYFKKQPPRVLDYIDIVILKGLQERCDLRYKTWVLDVSQNVDRATVFMSNFVSKFGTIGCITPSGQPILTDQMRPITGIEALGLQGLPLDDLVLSTETQAQLLDLAGNAMTVPVVGAVILSALAAAYDILLETAADTVDSAGASDNAVGGEDQGMKVPLEEVQSWDLGSFQGASLNKMTALAAMAVRLCFCQSADGSGWLRCQDCGATACERCSGNPRHRFAPLDVPRRMSQAEVQLQLKSCLPGVFEMVADCSNISGLLAREGCEQRYVAEVCNFLGRNRFFFQRVTVTENVTVDYKSTNCVARLVLTNMSADWYLFPARQAQDTESCLKDTCPIARGKFILGPRKLIESERTLDPREAEWLVWARRHCAHNLLIERQTVHQEGSAVQALRVRLTEADPASLKTSNVFPEHVLKAIEEQVSGVYCHRPRCGGAEDSLFVRQGAAPEQFLFKEVASIGHPDEDAFVFATTHRQLEMGEYRDVSLRTGELSMPPARGNIVMAYVDGYWAACDEEAFSSRVPESLVRLPLAVGAPSVYEGSTFPCCKVKPATLFSLHLSVTELPLPLATVSRWTNGRFGPLNYYAVPHSRLEGFLRDVAFASSRIFQVGAARMAQFSVKGIGAEVDFCGECCIPPPKNHWHCADGTYAARPWEDPDDVEAFEQRVKKLPPPFAAMVKFAGQSFPDHSNGALDIIFTLNPRTLPSRAMAHLAYNTRSGSFSDAVIRHSKTFCEVDWQYHPQTVLDSLIPFHKAIHDTTNLYGLREDLFRDKIAEAPLDLPSFRQAGHFLRADQVEAVRWMIGREVCPASYRETELEEVVLSSLNTRIVGRAVFENDGSILCSRGGVAAHDIGYGKTVVVIALLELRRNFDGDGSIDERKKAAALWNAPHRYSESFFHLKATLIIVPGHISDQWISEFRKFGSTAKIVKIPDVKTLEKHSLKTMQDADVIVVSEGLFRSTAYLEHIDRLGASPGSRSKPSGREAQDRYRICTQMIRKAVWQYLNNGNDEKATNEVLLKLAEARQRASQCLAQEYAGPSTRKSAKRGKTNGGGSRDSSSSGSGQARGRQRKKPGKEQSELVLWHPTLFLENFSFARIIVDEYSYQGAPTLSFLSGSLAYARWLLSGTPPSQNLANITDVGLALGIHVARPEPCVRPGLPPVTEGPKLHPMSASEEFRSFSTRIKSIDFTAERHRHAVEFVQHVYRSNEVDHSHILVKENVVPVRLHPRTAVYYNVAHLEILDANGNLLQVPMDLRTLLNRVNVTATNTGEAAAGLALAAIANGVLGNGDWYHEMVLALFKTLAKFGKDAKFYFDKLVWLLDRALSVDSQLRNDSKFQSVRKVAESIVHDFIKGFRGQDTDLTQYGGHLAFMRLMSKIAPATTISHLETREFTLRALYVPPSEPSDFDPRLWRRDMALTCWLDWYKVEQSQVTVMDRKELMHLASDLILLSYSTEAGCDLEADSVLDWLSGHASVIRSLFDNGGYENWRLRKNTLRRSMTYEKVGRPIVQKLDASVLAKFIMDCQTYKIDATQAIKLSCSIDTAGKIDRAWLRELCKNHNLRFNESDSSAALLDKINRYNRGMTDSSDHIDGRGCSKSQEFPLLNKIRKVRGSGTEATLDEISLTYQRIIRNLEDYVQASRRVEFSQSISRLAKDYPNAAASCDSCLAKLNVAADIFVVVACGHIVCFQCKANMDGDSERALCSVESCGAYCRNSPILRWADLCSGVPLEEVKSCDWANCTNIKQEAPDSTQLAAKQAPRGEKVAAIIDQVKRVPANDHVLLFVPFIWLAAELQRCLQEERISYITLVAEKPLSDQEMSSRAESFKTGVSKVLMLDPTEVSCAGINLTVANHVIFAAPFLDPDVYRRNQNMRQAIGRCVRPGQTKTVSVYHFMAENTIEERVLRDYAKTHQNPDNAIAQHFANSPKPWWMLDDGLVTNSTGNEAKSAEPCPRAPVAAIGRQEKAAQSTTQKGPLPLALAGGQLIEPSHKPDND